MKKHLPAAAGALVLLLLTALILLHPESRPLWPPLLAVALLFLTRSAAIALLSGAIAGTFLLTEKWFLAPLDFAQQHLLPAVLSPFHLAALAFTLLLAAFAVVVERSGHLASLLQRGGGKSSPRKFELSVVGLGLVCFFDGLANALMLGRVSRTLADQHGVSRQRLAYLVDTTSSAVACVAFLSTWTITQLTLIEAAVADSAFAEPAYLLFLRSIPTNFYCLSSLLLVILVVAKGRTLPPLASCKPLPAPVVAESVERVSTFRALLPIIALLLSVPLAFWLLGGSGFFPTTLADVQAAFSTSRGPQALVLSGVFALLAALFLFPRKKSEAFAAIPSAIASILPALLILVLAWTLGSTMKALETGQYLASLLGGDFPFRALPAFVFLTGCLISFSTGTSWGAMGLLMPIALETVLAQATQQSLAVDAVMPVLLMSIGAVFGGAVFGDHASPFSDTTIVSALACDISTTAHVSTQIPFALVVTSVSLVFGYGTFLLTGSLLLAAILPLIATILAVHLFPHQTV